jgi:2-polyprenyl-6-methoxyphenol hydroxylase-like FAD-dependent oxidoreductase
MANIRNGDVREGSKREEAVMGSEDAERVGALVVGGSLAGLTCALGLSRAGVQVTVLERSVGRRSGAALAADPDDLEDVLGADAAAIVLDRLAGPGHQPRGSQSVAWEDLRDGLARAAQRDPAVTVLDGRRVVAVGQDARTAWVRTDDGAEHRADVLVGADGHRSRVRGLVSPDRPNAEYAGYLLWVGIANERDLDLSGPWPSGLDIQSAGNHLLLGYPLPGPDGGLRPGTRRLGFAWYDAGRTRLLTSNGAVRGGVVRHSVRAEEVPEEIYRELPARAARSWSSPWAEAIADSAERRAITATPIAEYVPERLVRGRVGLVGNAAHVPSPMTGSGFAVSLEDAGSLARHLVKATPSEVPDALLAFEAERLGPARELVQSGQGFSRAFAGR